MFSSKDILWVRNVKREGGHGWAYMEEEDKDEFILHWSSRYKDGNEALKPAFGELILLFQTPNAAGHTQLTHLVTPLDNVPIDCSDTNPNYKWGRRVAVVARAPNGKNPKPHILNFTPVNQTHSYEIKHIASDVPRSQVPRIIWESFRGSFNPNYEVYIADALTPLIEFPGVNEGALRAELKLHLFRERDSRIIQQKKVEAETLNCECCNFDFEKVFGQHGRNYIECHHRVPINQGERITTPDQLALVCANCHRMLHRKNDNGEYYEVEELKELIESLNE